VSQPSYAQRYRLVEALPPGRAVAVHRAVDAGRPVEIAVVRPGDADRFAAEMTAVAQVRHLGLPAVIEIGRDGSDAFVVYEDARGEDASELVAPGPLPVGDAMLLVAQAAAALAALHDGGAVHGGVEPATFVKTRDGLVKLTGAGLGSAFPPADLLPGATPEGARYLSPEEVTGLPAGPASDVYRLGLVLYLLLTGRHAFDGPDAPAVAREQLEGVVRPPQFRNPEVPPSVAQLALRTLDKDPARRGSAAQLQRDLETVLASARTESGPPVQKPRSRAWIWSLAVLAIAALAVLGVLWGAGAFSDEEAPAATVTVPDVVGMTEQAATNALADAGLRVGDIVQTPSDTSPAGTVAEQTPAAGSTVPEQTEVALQVSTGPSPSPTAAVAVPDVVGQSQADAEAALLGAGFVVVLVQASSGTVADGVVISQAPSTGVLAQPGSTVRIVVSTGPGASPTASPSP
jgi:serine/threonine-protein kinase